MERCSTSLDIREMQIITTIKYYFTPTRMAIIKKTITSVSKDMEKSEPLYIACRMYQQNGVTSLENSFAVSQNIKPRVTL